MPDPRKEERLENYGQRVIHDYKEGLVFTEIFLTLKPKEKMRDADVCTSEGVWHTVCGRQYRDRNLRPLNLICLSHWEEFRFCG